ncbi:hypothetical protein U1Q18_034479, partial [Sarracenia purpurea var. burkii]
EKTNSASIQRRRNEKSIGVDSGRRRNQRSRGVVCVDSEEKPEEGVIDSSDKATDEIDSDEPKSKSIEGENGRDFRRGVAGVNFKNPESN